MATGSRLPMLRLILTSMLVTGLLNFCYQEDTSLSYGLCSAVRWEARVARPVAETLKNIRQRGRGRGNVFLNSRVYYTANGNSTFQLHRITNAGDVQTNPGPSNSMKQPKYPCKECGKNVRSNQDALLCADCNSWVHAKCLGLTKAAFKNNLDYPDTDWTCLLCSLPFATMDYPFETDADKKVNTNATNITKEASYFENDYAQSGPSEFPGALDFGRKEKQFEWRFCCTSEHQ